VDEAFKGSKQGQKFEIAQILSSCAGEFKTGERVLMYLYPGKEPGSWTASGGCSRNINPEFAQDDLLFLRVGEGHEALRGGRVV
jgi:hypothetical protein